MVMRCPRCGNEVSRDEVFCGQCGAPITNQPPAQPTEMVNTPSPHAGLLSSYNTRLAPQSSSSNLAQRLKRPIRTAVERLHHLNPLNLRHLVRHHLNLGNLAPSSRQTSTRMLPKPFHLYRLTTTRPIHSKVFQEPPCPAVIPAQERPMVPRRNHSNQETTLLLDIHSHKRCPQDRALVTDTGRRETLRRHPKRSAAMSS